MSKSRVLSVAIALTVLVAANGGALAESGKSGAKKSKTQSGLNDTQRQEVQTIVNGAKEELLNQIEKGNEKLAALITASGRKAEAAGTVNELASATALSEPTKLKVLQAAIQQVSGASTNASSSTGGVEFEKYLQEALDKAKQCEDRDRVRKALRCVIGVGDGTKASGSCCDAWPAACKYTNPDGTIDVNALLKCEIQRQVDIENRAKLRKAFNRLLSDDKCCEDRCTETKPTCKQTSYYAPSYSSVVLERPAYYHPICFE